MVDSGSHIRGTLDHLDRGVGKGGHGRVEARSGGLEGGRSLHSGDSGDRVFDRFRISRGSRHGVVRLQVGRAGPLHARGRGLEQLGDRGLRGERGPGLEDALKGAGSGSSGRALEVGRGGRRCFFGVLDAEGDLLGGGAGGAGDSRGLEVLDGLLDLAEVSLLSCFFRVFLVV